MPRRMKRRVYRYRKNPLTKKYPRRARYSLADKGDAYIGRRATAVHKGKRVFPRVYRYGGKYFAAPTSRAWPKQALINPRRRRKARRNPVMKRYTRRRTYRRNPAIMSIVKSTVNQKNLVKLGAISGGFIGGSMVNTKVKDLIATQFPAMGVWGDRLSGVVTAIIGGIIAGQSRQSILKDAGLGVSVSGIYDVIKSLMAEYAPDVNLGMDFTALGRDIGTPGAGMMARPETFTSSPASFGMDYAPASSGLGLELDDADMCEMSH